MSIKVFSLGGKISGGQPLNGLIGGGGGSNGGSGMIGSSSRGTDRIIIRQAFGNNRIISTIASPLTLDTAKTTPFRRAYHAGDTAGTVNEAPSSILPGSNQVTGRSISMLNIMSGGPHNDGSALFSGNPKFVYDSSDYIRYKKINAVNKLYNDSSFGGGNNGSYVPLKHSRH